MNDSVDSSKRGFGLLIEKLSWDYLRVDSLVHQFEEEMESPDIFKRDDTYFLFASQLTGMSLTLCKLEPAY